eukprot:gene380-491_t
MWKRAVSIAAAVVAIARCEIPEEEGVLVLSSDNFDEAITSNKYIVVQFFAPWCGHCKQLAPEYSKAAREMKASAHPIPFAKIDATNHTTIAERYDVQGFPTIKLFNSGLDIEYSGGRKDINLMAWVRKKTGAATTLLTEENYDEVSKKVPAVLGCFAEGSAEYLAWESVAKEIAHSAFQLALRISGTEVAAAASRRHSSKTDFRSSVFATFAEDIAIRVTRAAVPENIGSQGDAARTIGWDTYNSGPGAAPKSLPDERMFIGGPGHVLHRDIFVDLLVHRRTYKLRNCPAPSFMGLGSLQQPLLLPHPLPRPAEFFDSKRKLPQEVALLLVEVGLQLLEGLRRDAAVFGRGRRMQKRGQDGDDEFGDGLTTHNFADYEKKEEKADASTCLTGAGISVKSGIFDYRSSREYWGGLLPHLKTRWNSLNGGAKKKCEAQAEEEYEARARDRKAKAKKTPTACNFAHAFSGSAPCTKIGDTVPSAKLLGPTEELTQYEGDFTELDLTSFVKLYRHPLVVPFSGEVAEDVFEDGRPLLFYFRNKNSLNTDLEEAFATVAKEFRAKILFSSSGVNEPMENRLMDYIGVEDGHPPTVRIIKDPVKGMTKYKLDTEISESSLRQFAQDFLDNKLIPHLRSEPVPAANPGPVIDLVGKSFSDVVMDTTKDVLVEFYAPWCGHCTKFKPVYEEFARKITSASKDVVIARMDASVNDVEGLEVGGYPSLRLWRADRKETVLEFDQDRTVENLDDWMQEHGSYSLQAAAKGKTELTANNMDRDSLHWDIDASESIGNDRYIYLVQEFGLKVGGEVKVDLEVIEGKSDKQYREEQKSPAYISSGVQDSESLGEPDPPANELIAFSPQGKYDLMQEPAEFTDGGNSSTVYFMLLTEEQLLLYLADALAMWPTPYVVSSFRKPFPKGRALNITIPIEKEDLYSALLMQVGKRELRLKGRWSFTNPTTELSAQIEWKPIILSAFWWFISASCVIITMIFASINGRFRVHAGHRLILLSLLLRGFSFWFQGQYLAWVGDNGTASWPIAQLIDILDHVQGILQLVVMMIISLGLYTMRGSLNFVEIRFILCIATLSFYLSLFEVFAQSDTRDGYLLCRMILHSLAYLCILVAINFNIQVLKSKIAESPISRTVGSLYQVMRSFTTFRGLFILFLISPTLNVMFVDGMMTWQDQWLMDFIHFSFDTGLYFALLYIFRPKRRFRLFEIILQQRSRMNQDEDNPGANNALEQLQEIDDEDEIDENDDEFLADEIIMQGDDGDDDVSAEDGET